MTIRSQSDSNSNSSGVRVPKRRARAGRWAGAVALALLATTAGAARAWIAAVMPDAVLVVPPPSVLPGNPTAPDIWAFNEKQNVILDVGILLDVQPVNPSVRLPQDLNPVWIPAGTCVSSHYLSYEDTMASVVTGGASFVTPILGVALRQVTLDNTNFLGAPGNPAAGIPPTMYPVAANCAAVPGVNCGLELLPQDELRVDPFRVQVRFEAQTPGDRLRVITLPGNPAKCHHIGDGHDD